MYRRLLTWLYYRMARRDSKRAAQGDFGEAFHGNGIDPEGEDLNDLYVFVATTEDGAILLALRTEHGWQSIHTSSRARAYVAWNSLVVENPIFREPGPRVVMRHYKCVEDLESVR